MRRKEERLITEERYEKVFFGQNARPEKEDGWGLY